jgi:hypothetical protein
MKPGTVLTFPGRAVFRQMRNVSTLLDSLKHIPGETRSIQEMKRIILRSVALKYLIKTYFGKGNFKWQDPYQIYKNCLRALDKFSLPRPFHNLAKVKHDTVTGRLGFEVPAERLEDLRANASDSNELMEAKREAIIQFIAQKFVGLTAGRGPNFREMCDQSSPESNILPRTASSDFMREAMQPILEILRTHLPHCTNLVRKAIEEFILEPSLPFDIELPGSPN